MEHANYMHKLPGGHCFYCHQDYPDEHDYIECAKVNKENYHYPCTEACIMSKFYHGRNPFAVGAKVEKIKGYKFRGTIVSTGVKSDGKKFAVVEIESGENAEGLLYIHPLDALKVCQN